MPQIPLSAEDLKCLSRVLSAALDETVQIDCLEDVGVGSNKSRHKKALLTSGRIIGLKAAERVNKGTIREYLLAYTARILNIPGSGACGIFQMPDDLPLARKQVVALEWLLDAKQIAELKNPSDKRKSLDTARQLGQWIWLCLYFGVSDRGMANWVWSESSSTIAMIDYEDWTQGSQTPEGLNSVVREILIGSVGDISFEQARELREGMKIAKDCLATPEGQLSPIFANYGESLNSPYNKSDVVEVASKITGIAEKDLSC